MANNTIPARILRLSVTEGAFATVMGSLTGGVFLTGLAIAMGASRLDVGVLAALPTLANVFQIAGSFVLERRACNKALCVGALATSRLLLLPIVAAPWLFSRSTAVSWLIGLVALSCVLNAMGGVAWLSWIRGLVPLHERIRYLGIRNVFNTGLSMILCLAGGLLVEGWNRGHADPTQGFLLPFAIGIGAGLTGIAFMAAIPDANTAPQAIPRFRSLMASVARETNFRRLISFYGVWQLASQMAAPFYAVYMLQHLQLPFWSVTLLMVLSNLCGISTTPFWTRMAQRFGIKPTVYAATLADAFVPLAWLFVEQPWAWLVIPIHLAGLLNAPLTVGPNNLVLKLAPENHGTPYIATFNAVVGPIAGFAAVLGGYLAGVFPIITAELGGVTFGGLKLVFLLSFVGRLASLLILRHIEEPGCEPMLQVIRILRRVRRRRLTKTIPELRTAA
jgi:hypothetical protein